MTNISKEQEQKLWEWRGLDLRHDFQVADFGVWICSKCGGAKPPIFKNCKVPDLTLDNLFKYAVPKLAFIILTGIWISDRERHEYSVSVAYRGKEGKSDLMPDPATALALAILEVIE